MRLRLITIAVLLAGVAYGQTPVNVEQIKPDCTIYFTLTTALPNSVTFDNRQTACTNWTVTYLSNTYAALSLLVQGAPDNAGAPGAWAAFTGATLSGVNPNIAITAASSTLFGYQPWMRVALTALGAGTVTGRLYGFRQSSAVLLAGGPGPGGAFFGYIGCGSRSTISVAASGNTRIIPESGTTIIRICHVSASTTAGENIKLTYGTGAACAGGGGPVDLTGFYYGASAVALDFMGSLIVPSGMALCINQSAAQTIGGVVTYSQY